MSAKNKARNRKASPGSPIETEELRAIDASCRPALLFLFLAATGWLLVGSVFGLISSIKFHQPSFLADAAWLTYGRTRPAFFNALIYGFCVPGVLGVMLWYFARLGRIPLVSGWLAMIGTGFWNFGVAVGLFSVLTGNSTGHQYLEMPFQAAPALFCGYALIGLCGAITLHNRSNRSLYPSHWFFLAALFWFPWIYSTAQLLISVFPSRGIVQSIIAWWFARNLTGVWLLLSGLGILFYFLPKLLGRDLTSRHLALFVFWSILLFAPWGGIPSTAPVPAWMPVLSTTASIMMIVPLVGAGLILFRTGAGAFSSLWREPAGRFVLGAMVCFLISAVMDLLLAWPATGRRLGTSWFAYGHAQLTLWGFMGLNLMGAIYYILPRIAGIENRPPVKLNFALWAGGLALAAVPLVFAGLREASLVSQWQVPFMEVVQSTLMFLRLSTVGELLLVAASAVPTLFISMIIARRWREQARSGYAEATKDLFEPTRAKT